MKAGTAQKVVLNLFSTLVMVRLGRVHRGLMVDMQRDQRQAARAARVRMLRHLTGARRGARPRAALARSRRTREDRGAACCAVSISPRPRRIAARHGGHLRAALAELPP